MRVYFSIFVIIVLTLFTFGENRSSTYRHIELEKLDEAQNEQLLRIFYSDKYERIDTYLKKANKRYGFNGNVLVAYDGEVILQESYGYENFRNKAPLTDSSVFQLASVSKQFTAVAILILHEQGKLNLNEDICTYIPELPYEGISVKNLLQHTGGLANYMWMLEHHWESTKLPKNSDLINLMAELKMSVYFSPGRKHDYSNTGYVILASIVEAISGELFGEFVNENIFNPLEMNNSFVYSAAYDIEYPEKLDGYIRKWRRLRVYDQTVHDGIVGDKAVYSTSGDLFKWDQSLYDHSLVSKESLEEAFTCGKIRNRWKFPYGYGFRLKYINNKKVVYHKGLWEGFRTSFSRFIDDRNTVIILNNTNCGSIYSIIEKVERIANEEVQLAPEYEIIRTAISYGYEYGIDRYNLIKEENPEIILNHSLFEKAILNLESNEKQQLVSIISQISKNI